MAQVNNVSRRGMLSAALSASAAFGPIFEPHYHERATEIYHILDGQGSVTLNGEEHQVAKGSFVHIPPGVVHSMKGPVPALIMGVPAVSTDDDMFFPKAVEPISAATA